MDRDSDDYIPGTEHILSDIEKGLKGADGTELKRDGNIILIPQPSNSPNDPLNWSAGRKYWHMLVVCFVTAFTAATSNDAGAAQNDMNFYLGIPWTVFNTGAGVLFIGIGYWTFLQSPTAFLYGRRVGYLFCLFLGLGGSIWFGFVKTSRDAIWSQLFVGASEAVAEAQVQLSLMDVFFQHRASFAISLYIMCTSIGTYLGPLAAGYIADNLGSEWVGKMGAIISGFAIVLVYFGMEETYFDRSSVQRTTYEGTSGRDSGTVTEFADKSLMKSAEVDQEPSQELDSSSSSSQVVPAQVIESSPEPRKGYWTMVKLITPATNLKGFGFKQYINRLYLTLRVFAFPAVLYSGLQWGAQDAWLTFYISAEDDNWSEPPYNYGDAGVAIMNVPTLIGALIGCVYGGYCSDKIVYYLTKRNNGIQEAEFRLWALLPTAIICPLGMFLFGIGTQQDWDWFPSYFGLVLIGFGWGTCGDLSMSYLIDCYPNMVLEGMVGVSVINNTIGMIFSFVCDPWMNAMSIQNVFISIGVLEFGFIMLTVPMMIWGKKCRKMTKQLYFNFIEARDSMEN
jgi:MFS family permease